MVPEADLDAYARGFLARFGDRAVAYARDHAEQLRAAGDHQGHDVWHRVADLIAREHGDHHHAKAA
jgi:hypothetical protein